MDDNLKTYLSNLLKDQGPLQTEALLHIVETQVKATLKQDPSFKSTCKKDITGTQRRVWTVQKPKTFTDLYPDRDPGNGSICKPSVQDRTLCSNCPAYDTCRAMTRIKQIDQGPLVIID